MNRELQAILRTDLRYFVRKVFKTVSPGESYHHNWHIEAIVRQILLVHHGQNRRLLINQPPRSLKSICVSVAYVAWLLGHDPSRRVIVVSYSVDFASELHRQFRAVVDSDWFRRLFPDTQWTKETGLDMVTTQGGGRLATSVGGTLTGRGADLIIVDDPLNANEALSEPARKRVIDWYGGALVSRLNNKETGSIIAVMQRLHEDDLAGHLLRQGGWSHLDLPAIAINRETIDLGDGKIRVREPGEVLHPDREGRAALDAIKTEIGSLLFSAQYQQQPIPLEGNLIRREWLRKYDHLPQASFGTKIVQSWDVAMLTGNQHDFSVCTTWMIQNNDYYLVHVNRRRLEYPDLRRLVIAMASEYRATTVLIEEAGAGLQLLQDLRHTMPNGMTRPIGCKPVGTKLERMAAPSAKIEAGHILLPKDASWLDDFLLEVLSFPNGRHDDQVDSLSQFVNWAQQDSYLNSCPIVVPIIVSTPRHSQFDNHG